jgi:hypothetical protein
MSDVTEALAALQAGGRTLDEVVAMFRSRTWPVPATPPPGTLADEAFPPEPEGSFAEVSVAYSAGVITDEQYAALAEAAAQAMPGKPGRVTRGLGWDEPHLKG